MTTLKQLNETVCAARFLVVFIVENTRRVTVRLIVPEVHTSLAVALLIAEVLGALVLLLVQHRREHGSR